MKSKGFLVVATKDRRYLNSAIFLADSIKDHYPEAKITLFTEEAWKEENDMSHLFETVVYGDFNHIRTKLYALTQTPYDITCYLDADMYCEHEDISLVFDQIDESADIAMTEIRPYNGAISKFKGGELTLHCGMFLYHKTPKVIEFMEQWWNLYQKQISGEWKWDTDLYPERLRPWDQWSFWWLQNKTDHKLTVQILDDDARWNFVIGYKADECKQPIVLRHERIVAYGRY